MIRIKKCRDCEEEFKAITGSQRLCDKCLKEARIKHDIQMLNGAKKSYKINSKINPDKFRERSKKSFKKWYAKEENKKKMNDYLKKYYHKHKDKWNIRSYSHHKIRKELLRENRYCKYCNGKENLEIHHLKYTKIPEDCIVLCRDCHRKLHRRLITK